MNPAPFFSIIVPVYNRPQEVDELLNSLLSQKYSSFEVIVVEDGSTVNCRNIIDRYVDQLSIRYFEQSNQGPGPARNFGFNQAKGDYFISFDSDCIIPPDYLESVIEFMKKHTVDAWGGPDRGHSSFGAQQQAMAYTMSAFLTTGGIRGGRAVLGRFQPRSFNMGLSRKVFESTGGFRFDRYAEDIELSIRIRESGFQSWLIHEAFVYHKRRTDFSSFFKQVINFGKGRVDVSRVHPNTIKLTHWFPLIFTFGLVVGFLLGLFYPNLLYTTLFFYGLYFLMVGMGSLLSNHSLVASLYSIPAAFIQLIGYAYGFSSALFSRND